MNVPLTPKIRQRKVDQHIYQQAVREGFDEITARILASRQILIDQDIQSWVTPSLKGLSHPGKLKDIDKATARLVQAMADGEVIGLETDHDCDGQTSHAVIHSALTQIFGYPENKVCSFIGHRLEEGYGLSQALAERICHHSPKPSLIITADNGSSDEARIAYLKAQGIDVIVTDHHEIPKEGVPQSAVAVLNPTQEGCAYPDRLIAGCMVAWLFMAATRAELIQKGMLAKTAPNCGQLLDFVALGTIADCVSMSQSFNNRAVVIHGLKKIQAFRRPCWQALKADLPATVTSEDLGFLIGPLLNSDGRLSDALGSVSFLLSEDLQTAQRWVTHLKTQNAERKTVQKSITEKGVVIANQLVKQNYHTLSLFIEDGHSGVHGISASRIKDMFGRPTVVFSPKYQRSELITGSARSIDELHLRDVLQQIADEHPQLLVSFGGHSGAAGLTIHKKDFALFQRAFETVVQKTLPKEVTLGPVIETDGALDANVLSLSYIEQLLSTLTPFGRAFSPPVFEGNFSLLGVRLVGQDKKHAQCQLALEDGYFEAIWFNCPDWAGDMSLEQEVMVAYSPRVEIFRGQKKLKLMIEALEPATISQTVAES